MIFYDYLKSKDVTDKNINEFVKGLNTKFNYQTNTINWNSLS